MAKLPEKNYPNTKISASQILTYLQKNNLTNEVFIEILSDLKNKQGFRNLRKMVEDLIHSHESQLYSPRTEKSQRASIINEICTVGYTIDIIFPNILRMKFQNQFPKLVNDILDELKAEKKIKCFVPYVPGTIDDSSAGTRRAISPSNSSDHQSGSSNRTAKTAIVPHEDIQEIQMSTKENEVESDQEDIDNFEISKENLSVSSVHTSELSSFDDTISISSDNEQNGGQKKRFSIKELQQWNKSEKISSWLTQNFKSNTPKSESTKTKARKNSSLKSKENNMSREKKNVSFSNAKLSSSDESSLPGSPKDSNFSPKTLPKRKRIPNSKYTSESIVCPISAEQRRKKRSEMDNSDSLSPHKKTKIIKSETENEQLKIIGGTPKKNEYKTANIQSTDMSKSAPATLNIFKPFTSVMPLTSRKTAPKTLFSTQNMK